MRETPEVGEATESLEEGLLAAPTLSIFLGA